MEPNRDFIDFYLIFSSHPITHDITRLKNEKSVQQAIRNLVLTQHYEMPFHPEIGCYTTSLLFNNIMPSTLIMIKKSIETVIRNFEPRVYLRNVNVEVSPDENGYQVRIEYNVVNQPDPLIFDMFLERLR